MDTKEHLSNTSVKSKLLKYAFELICGYGVHSKYGIVGEYIVSREFSAHHFAALVKIVENGQTPLTELDSEHFVSKDLIEIGLATTLYVEPHSSPELLSIPDTYIGATMLGYEVKQALLLK